MKANKKQIKSAFLGLIIGDALGVPVEFKTRAYLEESPVNDMLGYGTYNQAPGTWSDDSSMMLCSAESLLDGFNSQLMAELFVKWYKKSYWTPYDNTFDIGNTTAESLNNVVGGVPPEQAGGNDERSNGNGSLMRILPLAFVMDGLSEVQKFEMIRKASSITHRHIRSVIGCYIYIKYIEALLTEKSTYSAYSKMQNEALSFLKGQNIDKTEIARYHRILKKDVYNLEEYQIESEGYVVYTLEAALWSFLNSSSYRETVLKAVNLGSDTDTTGAVAGGIAGLYYGFDKFPKSWIEQIARLNDIEQLIGKFGDKYV